MTDPLLVGLAVLDRFSRLNARRRAQGEALGRAIEAIEHAEPGLSGDRVLAKICAGEVNTLGRSAMPSLRTVQLHLQRIRAARRCCA